MTLLDAHAKTHTIIIELHHSFSDVTEGRDKENGWPEHRGKVYVPGKRDQLATYAVFTQVVVLQL